MYIKKTTSPSALMWWRSGEMRKNVRFDFLFFSRWRGFEPHNFTIFCRQFFPFSSFLFFFVWLLLFRFDFCIPFRYLLPLQGFFIFSLFSHMVLRLNSKPLGSRATEFLTFYIQIAKMKTGKNFKPNRSC